MSNNELVSVIIPVFNARPYISEAIESVLHQTYKHLEIIIIDDGSTDSSEAVCDEYAQRDKRIIVVHKQNEGVSAARNTGLDLMNGDVVAFLDSDDAFQPDFVSVLLDALIRERADVAMCKYTVHSTVEEMKKSGEQKEVPGMEEGVYDRADALRALNDRKINHAIWNKLYRQELWEKNRFPSGHMYEDVDTTFRIINLCNKFCVVNQSLYMYRRRLESITKCTSINGYRDWDMTHARFERFISANVPEIFSSLQLRQRCQSRMDAMITRYVNISDKKEIEWKEYSKDLRKQIVDFGKEIGIRNCRRSIQIKYWAIRICPNLLKPAVSAFNSARQITGKAVGRC